jgi:uncharacterized protein YqkB
MTVSTLLKSVRQVLQDYDKEYWDDSELLTYYNECKRTMAQERLEIKTTATLLLDPLKNEYDTDGVLRYIRAVDDEGTTRKFYPNDETIGADNTGIIIKDYNKIYVQDPTIGTTITMEIVSLPSDDNLEGTVRLGDENAFKYYILSKSYEKESDMENFQKSDYFYQKYLREFAKLMDSASANYNTATVNKTEANYF